MKIITWPLLLACLALLWCGCQHKNRQTVEQAPLIRLDLSDGLGHQLHLPATPQRIVSLSPRLTHWLFSLQAQGRLVATVPDELAIDDPFPPELERIAVYPDFEAGLQRLVALKPDLVLIGPEYFSEPKVLQQTLDSLGINSYYSNANNMTELYQELPIIGQLVDRQPEAQQFVAQFQEFMEAINKDLKAEKTSKMALLYQLEPFRLTGAQHWTQEMISATRGQNVIDSKEELVSLSPQELAKLKPEIILVISDDPEQMRHFGNAFPDLVKTPAFKQRQVLPLSTANFKRLGPNIVDALGQLANALHPNYTPEHHYKRIFIAEKEGK
jgi:ABC-type Fe3+-hydroxamate transport system substrate-binding protein